MKDVTINVRGMHCASCVGHVERGLRRQPGVESVSVNLATERATVRFSDKPLTPSQLKQAVEDAGYEFGGLVGEPAGEDPDEDGQTRREDPGLSDGESHDPSAHRHHDGAVESHHAARIAAWRRRTLIGGVLALPVVILGMTWMSPVSAWIQLTLATPLQFWLGAAFYHGAWRALRRGRADMDTLVALGTTAAYAYSVYLMATHGAHGHLYFETAAVILVLIAAGRWMETSARGRASEAVRSLMKLRPSTATIVEGESEREVSVSELSHGDLVRIRPGGRAPVDGSVVDGSADFDESLITGESLPVRRSAGDHLYAGTINAGGGSVLVRAEGLGDDSLLALIMRLVDRAQSSKAHIQRLVDRVSGVFVPVVLVIGVLAVIGWGIFGGEGGTARGLEAAIAVWIVACPCALGLATPTAIMVGTAVGARSGILIKDAVALERAGRIDEIVLDKTGTLTQGRPSVQGVIALNGNDPAEALALAASVESQSEHVLARAIVEKAAADGLTLKRISGFESVTGSGVAATVDGRRIEIGRVGDTTGADEPSLSSEVRQRVDDLRNEGMTVAMVRVDGAPVALIQIGDEIKPGARLAVEALKKLGARVSLLTGDHQRTAEAVAAKVGIEHVIAGVRPDGKASEIERLRAQGLRVAMVGDGLNDAPALATSDLGIAMGAGTDAAMEAGHIVLVGDELRNVPRAVRLSRAMMRRIRLGLFWAFAYNTVLIPVAAIGLLHPMFAAAAMSLSSVSVVGNALLLKRARLD